MVRIPAPRLLEGAVIDRCAIVVVLAALCIGAPAGRLAAQQTQLDLHGNLAVGTATHPKSWGGGVGAQTTFGRSSDPLKISLSPSIDLLK